MDNKETATVTFGTSGWRGEIGTDITFNNVRIVTLAIINTLNTDDTSVKKALGIDNIDSVKERGIIVGHDNRYLGHEFAMQVIGMLLSEGIKAFYAGETSTPEISASVEMLNAACAINLTPSHNPSNYAGMKFNPSDGGPAGPEITDIIQSEANRLMSERTLISDKHPSETDFLGIDTSNLYMRYLEERGTLDIKKIRDFVNNSDCFIVIDHVHGSTRGRPQRLLSGGGNDISGKVKFLRTADDYLFGGVAPEPSEENMRLVEKELKDNTARFRLGVIMDPDGDRIRFADHHRQISMNYFGAMALHFMHVHKGINGIVAKSVGTSNFVNAIAERHDIPVVETRVGFKNFRPFMLRGSERKAIVAFEESDGISGFNHTLEKDALFGLLLAIEMMATTGRNLSDYLEELLMEYGYFYPARSGIEVERSLTGAPLKERLATIIKRYPEGSVMKLGQRELMVKKVIDVDGIKIVLEDGSWLMIRPSGTEPKVRFYIEARTSEEMEMILGKAADITNEALGRK